MLNICYFLLDFSADSLSARILDAKARVLVTGDGVYRGKKLIHLLEVADTALNIVKVRLYNSKVIIYTIIRIFAPLILQSII